jgi:mono/diheme cytochrome c family protein
MPAGSSAESPERAAKLRVVSEFYRANCLSCHGMDGIGSLVRPLMPSIPDLSSRKWQTSRSDTQVRTSILEGKGTLMPPYAAKVNAELTKDLIRLMRSFGPPDLLTSRSTKPATAAKSENQISSLQAQFDEIDKQLRELKPAPAKP